MSILSAQVNGNSSAGSSLDRQITEHNCEDNAAQLTRERTIHLYIVVIG